MARRNASLDILRAAAIILVVNCHIVSTLKAQGPLTLLQAGGKGVDLFFVLSGWLLGRQLLTELRDAGSIDIRRFWYRRWLRTLPAYFAVLAFTLAWQIFVRHNYSVDFSFLVFAQNYERTLPYFGVSWSLCVEEHFYLAVAPVLLLAFRLPSARLLLVPLLFLPLACRLMHWYSALHETHVRYDQCAMGVALASVNVFAPRYWGLLCRLAPYLAICALIALSRPLLLRSGVNYLGGDYDEGIYAIIFAAFVLLANSGPLYKNGLQSRVVSFTADRAYAIYLVHPEALALLNRSSGLPTSVAFLVGWGVSLVLAEVLHRLIERPFMQLRERIPSARTSERQLVSREQVIAEVQAHAIDPPIAQQPCEPPDQPPIVSGPPSQGVHRKAFAQQPLAQGTNGVQA
jgi:peptidoglycan/LPS O-acetylase OafA/YrhL